MKKLLLLGFAMGLFSANAQTISIPPDTVVQNDTVRITPYLSETSTCALGNFAVVGTDKIAFQTYAGLSVFNTLRGHVPNFSMGPNTSASTIGLRSNSTLLVIDGLPFNSEFSNFYNSNSFEYQSLVALSSGNATTLYGGAGANGAFFLQSKTGEGFKRSTFEFNSSTTLLSSETTTLLGEEGDPSNQLILTNAVAYKQDFGPVDTRVSYTYSHWPDGSSIADSKTNFHNLKLNTGFDITSRFKGRLILDDFYNRSFSTQEITYVDQTTYTSRTENVHKNLQGNLQLHYQILDWLSVSSQSSLGKIEYNDAYTAYIVNGEAIPRTTQRSQNRYFGNLYTSFNKLLLQDFTVNAFAGFQYEKLKIEQQFQSYQSGGGSFSERKTVSAIGGLGLRFKNYLFTDFNFRQEYVSVYADENNNVPSYSINTSFIFGDAFAWTNSNFSNGKFRLSVGKSRVAYGQDYPADWTSGTTVFSYANPGLHASAKQMFETGVDLGFMNNRLTFNTTYFSDYHKEIVGVIAVPTTGNGTRYLTANLWDLKSTGWEIVLDGTLLKKDNLTLTTKLIWTTFNSKLDSRHDIEPGENEKTILGNPNPDWTGSLLNQITFHNFFASFLIDGRKGGDIVTRNPNFGPYTPMFIIEDGSMAKLRDLSVGYRLSTKVLEKLKIREAQISMSGRNLWTMYSKTENEIESFNGTIPQKSGTLSLTLMF